MAEMIDRLIIWRLFLVAGGVSLFIHFGCVCNDETIEIVSVAVNLLFMSVIRFITKIYYKRNSIRKFIARSDIRPHAFPANEFICSTKHISLQLNSFVLAHIHLSVMDV